jgi:hypothetical protein
MYDELEGMWQEAVVACSRYYRGIRLEDLRQNEEILSENSRHSSKPQPEQNSPALQLSHLYNLTYTTPAVGASSLNVATNHRKAPCIWFHNAIRMWRKHLC